MFGIIANGTGGGVGVAAIADHIAVDSIVCDDGAGRVVVMRVV